MTSIIFPPSLIPSLHFHPTCACMHTAVHMHGDGYMTCMFYLFYSFTPYQGNMTPLYWASENGHHDVVQTLVGAGADANIARSVSDIYGVMFLYKYMYTLTSYYKVHALLITGLYTGHICTFLMCLHMCIERWGWGWYWIGEDCVSM